MADSLLNVINSGKVYDWQHILKCNSRVPAECQRSESTIDTYSQVITGDAGYVNLMKKWSVDGQWILKSDS